MNAEEIYLRLIEKNTEVAILKGKIERLEKELERMRADMLKEDE